ncbi:dehydrodolichyl diphosphate syntase complex subunit DHDDS isoform X1 [Fopius arisanus]|uniref:Alkyl transferase n=1 Tax=Fopius arisanus TaxID=64838 RepID=A0A9R1TJA9_9HYME|nr:PREDICTED: dehydrodolichyl diphosphate syntase complex subunit DHDDS isoform X1 [Fopius arisanus]
MTYTEKKMSWIRKNTLSFLQSLAVKIIKCGRIPQHVAFIMDGNRRYARKNKVAGIQGHAEGFNKLAETLQWCLDLGIKEVTVYAFSIENFKRNQKEVDALIDLARKKFQRLLDESDRLTENGVRISVIGNMSLIPEHLRQLMAKAMLITKDNDKAFLNIAFAYTSRDEITETVKTIAEGVKNNDIDTADVTEKLFSKCLYTSRSSDPDLIIRTSGEIRFSDYLLWQISHSYVHFSNVLWPESSIWDLLIAIFHYQRSYADLERMRLYQKAIDQPCSFRATTFANKIENNRRKLLEQLAVAIAHIPPKSKINPSFVNIK